MKLSELYSCISANGEMWQYYRNSSSDIFSVIVSKDENVPWGFICDFFDCGDKTSLLGGIGSQLSANRCKHILSTYLLGIALHERFYSACSEDFGIDANDDAKYGKNPWLYTWFLTCLFHDIGYVYEEGKEQFKMVARYKKLCNDELSFPLAVQYFKYRKKHGVADHGIVGGLILYTKLHDLFKNVLKNTVEKVQNNIYYGTALYDLHKIAACAIMRHNMWTADEKQEEEYKKAGLEPLIKGGTYSKLSVKNGFSFLLGLCDSIEPIKRFDCVETRFLLDHIDVCIGDSNLSIKFSPVLNARKYYRIVETFSAWLYVKTKASYDAEFGDNIDIMLEDKRSDLPEFSNLYF